MQSVFGLLLTAIYCMLYLLRCGWKHQHYAGVENWTPHLWPWTYSKPLRKSNLRVCLMIFTLLQRNETQQRKTNHVKKNWLPLPNQNLDMKLLKAVKVHKGTNVTYLFFVNSFSCLQWRHLFCVSAQMCCLWNSYNTIAWISPHFKSRPCLWQKSVAICEPLISDSSTTFVIYRQCSEAICQVENNKYECAVRFRGENVITVFTTHKASGMRN